MSAHDPQLFEAFEIRVRGRVQGVGFRPKIWHMARELGLAGEVLDDFDGVLLRVGGDRARLAAFLDGIESDLPPLARVDSIETRSYSGQLSSEFRIAESSSSRARTQIAPDAAICAACRAELGDRNDRHYRYPFTSCTHCGPRLSIVTAIPYDRAATTMAPFELCPDCRSEYDNPRDRRFHAEAIACPWCGPIARLIALRAAAGDGHPACDDVERAANLIRDGEVLAIKGIGGYHLACDAANVATLAQLRQLKRRPAKPFALMARDLDVIANTAASVPTRSASSQERKPRSSCCAPAVRDICPAAWRPASTRWASCCPRPRSISCFCRRWTRPLVMTSGNVSGTPPIIDDGQAGEQLAGIARYALAHDRRIANRVDNSSFASWTENRACSPGPRLRPEPDQTAGRLRSRARAGGHGRRAQGDVLPAQGRAGHPVAAPGRSGKRRDVLRLPEESGALSAIFAHSPAALVIDRHPEYLSSKLARVESRKHGLPLLEVQHHHAHVAACLAENGYPLDAPPVLGIVLDGLGFGDDGTIWGGEFLLADYRDYRRLAHSSRSPCPAAYRQSGGCGEISTRTSRRRSAGPSSPPSFRGSICMNICTANGASSWMP